MYSVQIKTRSTARYILFVSFFVGRVCSFTAYITLLYVSSRTTERQRQKKLFIIEINSWMVDFTTYKNSQHNNNNNNNEGSWLKSHYILLPMGDMLNLSPAELPAEYKRCYGNPSRIAVSIRVYSFMAEWTEEWLLSPVGMVLMSQMAHNQPTILPFVHHDTTIPHYKYNTTSGESI